MQIIAFMIQLIPPHKEIHSLTEQHSNRCSSRAQSKILLGGLNIPVSKQWCVYNTSILSFSVWAPPIQDIQSVCGETVSPLGLREMKHTHTHTRTHRCGNLQADIATRALCLTFTQTCTHHMLKEEKAEKNYIPHL